MELFTDRNLGARRFPEALRAAGVVVHTHQEHFAQDAPDTEWVPEVARRGWPILSPNLRIARDRLEVAAVMTSGAAMFCLSGGHTTAEAQAANVIRCLPAIERILATVARPFIAKIYQPSADDPGDTRTRRVEVKLTLPEWEARERRREG